MGNFTCGSSFRSGTYSRSDENLEGHRFTVIELDTLRHDEVGAVFAYLRRRLHYDLHCIVDTAGKSLHAWFDAPRNKLFEDGLKAGLEVFGCDPKVFTYSQPVRVPGAWREGGCRSWCGYGNETTEYTDHTEGNCREETQKSRRVIAPRCW